MIGRECTCLCGKDVNKKNGLRSHVTDSESSDMTLRLTLIWLALLSVLSLPLLTAPAQAEKPGTSVQKTANLAISKIGKGGSWSARRSASRKVVRSNFESATIGRLALGRYWKGLPSADRKLYLKTFEIALSEYILEVFSQYKGETIGVTRVSQDSRNAGIFNVESMLKKPNGQQIAVKWRVRKAGSRYKAIDIKIKGFSLMQSYRHEYTRFLKRNGGKIEILLKKMNKDISRSKAKRS